MFYLSKRTHTNLGGRYKYVSKKKYGIIHPTIFHLFTFTTCDLHVIRGKNNKNMR